MTPFKTTIFVAANNIAFDEDNNEHMHVCVCTDEKSAHAAILSNVLYRFSCYERLYESVTSKDIETVLANKLDVVEFTKNIAKYSSMDEQTKVQVLLKELADCGDVSIAAKEDVFNLLFNLDETVGSFNFETFEVDIKSLGQKLYVGVENVFCVENDDEREQADETPLSIVVSDSESEARISVIRSVLSYHAESIAELTDCDEETFQDSDSEAISSAYMDFATKSSEFSISEFFCLASDDAIIDIYERIICTDNFAGGFSINEFSLGFFGQ
ncbi:hypothetical protein [Photobacterium damselae]|uniref:hypothetical protein n=1 Tax=Photobacterium damselae TaxID=38293 RepID=UPI0040696082